MTRKAPLAMEPRSYSAEYESRYGALTLYTSSNVPGIVRDALSDSLDLPGQPFSRRRPRCRRQFRLQGIALSRGDSALHRRARNFAVR